jgi:hypothetical protein
MLHLPILRWGKPYRSVTTVVTPHFRTREPFVEMSQANVGLISRDLLKQADARARLQAIPVAELLRMAPKAADSFLNDTLPLDPESGTRQSPQDYVEQASATTGMPWSNVRRNMAKVHGVLSKVEEVLLGLTRGMELSVLDGGIGKTHGQMVSYFPRTEALGVVLPSNSPGVHSLWAPTTVLKMPLVLKPGSAEPWTPMRIIQAWIAAGAPAEAFCYYPTDHAGGNEILRSCGRGMVFGDVGSTRRWKNDPRVEVHGPGYSKVVIGPDAADDWEQYLDVIVESISNNGGRSCVNASGVWVTRHGDAIAAALARKLTAVVPRPADDPQAVLAPFANPDIARQIAATIDGDSGGAVPPIEVVTKFDSTFVLPAIARCGIDHPLANREFLFPFASVVQVNADQLPECLGPSLVVTCISNDPAFRARFVSSPLVDRLNFGAIPTTHIGWDQPHEGNLFEHLYSRRAIQRTA